MMPELFSESKYPEGFSYHPAFIDSDEENHLIETIERIELHPLIFQGFEAKRKVVSLGYDYHFDTRTISKGNEIPAEFTPIINKVAAQAGIDASEILQILLTEYPPGSVINWHRDAPPFDLIAGISLLSDCIFRLRPYEKAKQGRKSIISFPVERRSLYIMKGESRSEWEHSISPVKSKRYSITFRTLRK